MGATSGRLVQVCVFECGCVRRLGQPTRYCRAHGGPLVYAQSPTAYRKSRAHARWLATFSRRDKR